MNSQSKFCWFNKIRIQNSVHSEKITREETEEAILDTLRVMMNKIKGEIESERREREATEETLLSLIEDTCNKIASTTQL